MVLRNAFSSLTALTESNEIRICLTLYCAPKIIEWWSRVSSQNFVLYVIPGMFHCMNQIQKENCNSASSCSMNLDTILNFLIQLEHLMRPLLNWQIISIDTNWCYRYSENQQLVVSSRTISGLNVWWVISNFRLVDFCDRSVTGKYIYKFCRITRFPVFACTIKMLMKFIFNTVVSHHTTPKAVPIEKLQASVEMSPDVTLMDLIVHPYCGMWWKIMWKPRNETEKALNDIDSNTNFWNKMCWSVLSRQIGNISNKNQWVVILSNYCKWI